MSTSILNATKKSLGLAADYAPFDEELIIFINGGLSYLHQLGIGPPEGLAIIGPAETWEDFIGKNILPDGDPRLNAALTYMFLHVQLVFDTPQSPVVLQAKKELKEEAAWRIEVARDEIDHPYVPPVVEPTI